MRIVFMGANRTGWLCLRKTLEMGEEVVGVFTTPPRIHISYAQSGLDLVTHQPFGPLAAQHGIPLVTVEGKMGDYADALRHMAPDIVVVSGWYHNIPGSMLRIPPMGVVGFHPSLLPRYRGGAPLTWAIINGESVTGMTMFYLTSEVDAGDIIGQAQVPITPEDTIATLYDRINEATLGLVDEYMPRLREGTAPAVPQDHAQATYYPPRLPEDGEINWSWPTQRIYDWIRAQTRPYPGAYTYFHGQKLIVWSADLPQEPRNPAFGMEGRVIRVRKGQGVEVLTGDGSVVLAEAQVGDHCAPADEFLTAGDSLGLRARDLLAGS